MCTQVILPGLHISLGIFYRLFSLLEDACHQMDFKVAQSRASNTSTQSSFEEYIRCLHECRELEEEKSRVEEEASILEQASTYLTITISLPDPQGSALLKSMLEEAGNRRRVAQIVSIDNICTQYGVHESNYWVFLPPPTQNTNKQTNKHTNRQTHTQANNAGMLIHLVSQHWWVEVVHRSTFSPVGQPVD